MPAGCSRSSACVPQQLAGGDIYPALEKGTIDAAEWVGPYDDEKLGFPKVAKYYCYPGWWEGGPMVHNFFNIDKWQSLPKNYKAMVRTGGEGQHLDGVEIRMQNPSALKRLVAGGAKLRPFAPKSWTPASRRRTNSGHEISANNPEFKKPIDAMKAFRCDQYLWWQVAEYTNDSFMIRSRTRG